MSKKQRAGRKSWNTRVLYAQAVTAAASNISKMEFKYKNEFTKTLVIERVWDGKTQSISFSTAYGELAMWEFISFCNISGSGFSDLLVDWFLSGAIIYTGKAGYRLLSY